MVSTSLLLAFLCQFLFLCAASTAANNSEAVVCRRRPKLSQVGYDAYSLKNINMDVGKCRTNQRKTNHACVPGLIDLNRILMLNGQIKEVEVIQECLMVSLSSCQRRPLKVTFYSDTKFRDTIDVGACRGQCQQNTTCRSTNNITKNIKTPNGARSIQTIVECSCVPPCYKMTSFEAFPEQYTDSDGKPVMRTKIIDVGRCVGESCSRADISRSSFSDPRRARRLQCYPTNVKFHPFISTGGRLVNVSATETCTCE